MPSIVTLTNGHEVRLDLDIEVLHKQFGVVGVFLSKQAGIDGNVTVLGRHIVTARAA